MGANREMRRRMEREQVRNWKAQGRYEQIISLQRNGITQKDLDKAYQDGYQNGYMFASEKFFRKMYAAIAKELMEAGNPNDDIISFLHGVDHRFSVMFDAEEEIEDVYRATGINFVIDKNALNRIEEV